MADRLVVVAGLRKLVGEVEEKHPVVVEEIQQTEPTRHPRLVALLVEHRVLEERP